MVSALAEALESDQARAVIRQKQLEGTMGLFGQSEPEEIGIAVLDGAPLKCQVCGNKKFWKRDAQLHTGVASFFNVEWASPTCTCVICSACGYIHWFFPER